MCKILYVADSYFMLKFNNKLLTISKKYRLVYLLSVI